MTKEDRLAEALRLLLMLRRGFELYDLTFRAKVASEVLRDLDEVDEFLAAVAV